MKVDNTTTEATRTATVNTTWRTIGDKAQHEVDCMQSLETCRVSSSQSDNASYGVPNDAVRAPAVGARADVTPVCVVIAGMLREML